MPHILAKGKISDLRFREFSFPYGKVPGIYFSKEKNILFVEVCLIDGRNFIVEIKEKKDGVIFKIGSQFFIDRDDIVKKTLWLIYREFLFTEVIRTNIEEKFLNE